MSAGSRTLQRFRLNPAAYGRFGHTAIEGAHWEMTCRAPHSLHSTFGRCSEPIDGLTGLTFDEVSKTAREDLAHGVEPVSDLDITADAGGSAALEIGRGALEHILEAAATLERQVGQR